VIGPEIQRRINLGAGNQLRLRGIGRNRYYRASARRRIVARSRIVLHPNVFPRPFKGPTRNVCFGNDSSSGKDGGKGGAATLHGIIPKQTLWPPKAWSIGVKAGKLQKNRPFSGFSMQDHTSPGSLENAIALQKYGVGQPVRRKEDDTLVRGKGKYTDDFQLPRQVYAWIVRSSHA